MADRPDLAATLNTLLRSLVAAELPVLEKHGITMWGYIALGALCDKPVRTQAALAEAIGADKTRIISTLDRLQEAGLITREPDPADRRARLLSATAAGHARYQAVQGEIQANEDRLLATLPEADRRGFLRGVQALAALSREEIVGDPG
ncbi:MarR family winged helix-turn-helix transcriptional regulator [Nonomuraea gerenzanensis]|uniref:Transcriptional regulator, MarR family n=1 Tax=Nonomuraea gerenzanensis TaxID=93944 RepID=A0A1M4E0H1_9ACTN|nr:MarR family transcriptional regulator [Nonomuraea gerenzanensis]UBU14572.1 MarR family transcriptional regulator [Nonomuraea gerenzanensis]SBO92288.1 Transcriptional regulator, MarR family [Nonomuraea gerenzanensis]